MVLINPEILWSSDETRVYEEGCLSIPEYYDEVERPAAGAGPLPRPRRQAAARSRPTALLATCLQHEIDHLNGVLFIDYLSKLKRDRGHQEVRQAAARPKPRKPAKGV